MHEAVGMGRKKIAKYLIQKGADTTTANDEDETPVQIALRSGFTSDEIVEYFGESLMNL